MIQIAPLTTTDIVALAVAGVGAFSAIVAAFIAAGNRTKLGEIHVLVNGNIARIKRELIEARRALNAARIELSRREPPNAR